VGICYTSDLEICRLNFLPKIGEKVNAGVKFFYDRDFQNFFRSLPTGLNPYTLFLDQNAE
jgi:hypothetical protein